MAARKRKEDTQSSLFAAPTYAQTTTAAVEAVAPPPEPVTYPTFPPERAPIANEVESPAPPVRPRIWEPDGVAVVHTVDRRFSVRRLRHDGTTYVDVTFTEAELRSLRDCIDEVLR